MWAGQLHALMLCIQQLQLQTDSGFIHLLLCIQATVYAAMRCRRRHVARPEQTELHVLSLKQQLLTAGAGCRANIQLRVDVRPVPHRCTPGIYCCLCRLSQV